MLSMFVNGDSHTAQTYQDGQPTASEILAKKYGCDYENIALPGGSNQRIIRTTLERTNDLDPDSTLILIGWSSFERTEWYYKNQWYQICGDPGYSIDVELQDLHRQHIDSWWSDDNHECWRRQADQHWAIWVFHRILHSLGFSFLFYQGCKTFFFDGCPQQDLDFKLPWIQDTWVHDPYVQVTDQNQRIIDSFSYFSARQGFKHVDNRAHFGADAHAAWAHYIDMFVQKKLAMLKERSV
jgi:hypothetical protein